MAEIRIGKKIRLSTRAPLIIHYQLKVACISIFKRDINIRNLWIIKGTGGPHISYILYIYKHFRILVINVSRQFDEIQRWKYQVVPESSNRGSTRKYEFGEPNN
jgi:hypothetical protein